MQLTFFRHGIAFPYDDPSCPPDPERPLTGRGVQRTRAAADGLAALGVRPRQILTSPYRRCVETARIAAERLHIDESRIEKTDLLLFHSDPSRLRYETLALEVDALLLVGHRPHLDLVIADLLGLQRPATSLKKAGAASVLLTSTGVGTLEWVLTPRALRLLGGE